MSARVALWWNCHRRGCFQAGLVAESRACPMRQTPWPLSTRGAKVGCEAFALLSIQDLLHRLGQRWDLGVSQPTSSSNSPASSPDRSSTSSRRRSSLSIPARLRSASRPNRRCASHSDQESVFSDIRSQDLARIGELLKRIAAVALCGKRDSPCRLRVEIDPRHPAVDQAGISTAQGWCGSARAILVEVRQEHLTRRGWRGRVYSGSGFFALFLSVFVAPLSDALMLSPAGVAGSGFCSPWP
jgi:hypothetical protein